MAQSSPTEQSAPRPAQTPPAPVRAAPTERSPRQVFTDFASI